MAVNQNLFLDTVRILAGGKTQIELSEKLAECVKQAQLTGLTSKISLEISVMPDGQNGQYFLKSSNKVIYPQVNHGKTLVWGTPDGNLTRKDPNSFELDLRSVEGPKQKTETIAVKD